MATMYEVGEEDMVSGLGDVESGRLLLFKVWWRKGVRFEVEGGIIFFR